MRYTSQRRVENKKIAKERIMILNEQIETVEEPQLKKRYKEHISKLSKKYRVEICQKCYSLKEKCKCKDF
jgi:RNase P subunit RPR2